MKYNFHSEIPEIFNSLNEAQAAIDNNPLPYLKMEYSIIGGIISWDKKDDGSYKILKNKYQVSSFDDSGEWMGFLNTKEENI